jgi:hypothetical protein
MVQLNLLEMHEFLLDNLLYSIYPTLVALLTHGGLCILHARLMLELSYVKSA